MTINDLLDVARRRLDRLEATHAAAAVREGAVLVDVRSERDRERDGVISGALFFPRNVLEWRLDPASGHSAPELGDALDRWIILVCNEGYQSSLAAASAAGPRLRACDRRRRRLSGVARRRAPG
jgi:rhodanese-related sulfurtransferase